ncbi:hypothetical protein PHOSAC3_90339 [Mesotoga infera]|nr:hypothetical protein PHOSAC3_90339 [Mesotoga infera]
MKQILKFTFFVLISKDQILWLISEIQNSDSLNQLLFSQSGNSFKRIL